MKYCGKCGSSLQIREVDKRLVCVEDGCGYVFYNNPLPVVAAIVEYQGQVILVQNKGWPKSWFGLVTGFLEQNEDPKDGVLRELYEELGLKGTIQSLVGVYGFKERNEVIIAYHIKASGEIKMDETELAAYKLVDIDKLKPWAFGTGHAVNDWLLSQRMAPVSKL